ncbi:hypothetical protein V8E36_005013 [Tilletia maclaganii]
MKFSILNTLSLALAVATFALAHPSADAVLASNEARSVDAAAAAAAAEAANDLAIRDPHTNLSEFDGRDFARKDLHKRKRIVYKNAKITFYWGHQLDNPACGGPTPSEWEPVAAVKLSHGKAKCGDMLHVHYDCGSCTEDRLWVDLPRGVFSRLENLDVGVLDNAHVRVIHKN